MENNSCVSVKGLVKDYGKFTLGAIDFDIPMGFSTALIGANGAGKTTLIDILCGVIPKTSGEVTYFGGKEGIDSESVRERIGYCASSAFFPQAWTAKDIAVSMEIAFESFDRQLFLKLCEQLNVDSELVKKPKPMFRQSDGNRMRTSLAAVLSRKVDLLVLDEPGSSLDPLMRDKLCDTMRRFLDEGDAKRSIIFSTHNIADMENAADYVLFMDNGKIIERGFVEELKEKYIIVRGAAEDFEKVKYSLLSYDKNNTVFDGLALSDKVREIKAAGAAYEIPTLQQLSIGLLKAAEEKR